MLNRHPDWQCRLGDYLQSCSGKPFRYGSWDCCLHAADAIQVMTGVDLAKDFRGRYESRKEARALIRQRTGQRSLTALVEALSDLHNLTPVSMPYAQRGDLVLLKRASDVSVGIVDLAGHIAVPLACGLARLPLTAGLCAWRV